MVRKETVAIIEASHFHQLLQNFIQHPVKVNSISRGNSLGSWVWISSQLLIMYSAFVKRTWKERGIKRGSASGIFTLQESLRFR